jgi:hypothetical protein
VKRPHYIDEMYRNGRVSEVILLLRKALRKKGGNMRQTAMMLDMSLCNFKRWLRRFELMDEVKEISTRNRTKFRLHNDG